jgi:hypothetical protein
MGPGVDVGGDIVELAQAVQRELVHRAVVVADPDNRIQP